MSSSGITAVNSGPLILRTYLNSSINNTYVAEQYDYPASSNRILLTSTAGCLVPTDNLVISTVTVSSISVSTLVASTILASSISTNTISSLNGNISSLLVSTLSANSFSFSTLIASTVGIGTNTPSTALDIVGSVNISTVVSSSAVAYSAGIHTLTLPPGVKSLTFEMIGAGGLDTNGGTGGYIQGSIELPVGTLSITVGVGALGTTTFPSGTQTPSGASYINIPGSKLFVIAGAGGAANPLNAGGHGGGGSFSSGVAVGGNGVTGQGGQLATGGTGGAGCISGTGNNGAGINGAFGEALGGSGNATIGVALYAGGSGYTGGGAGCGGGGGSSYFNATYTTVTTSYAGGSVPGGVLPGYGRANQDGTVRISYNYAAINTNGDIVARNICAKDISATYVHVSTIFTAVSTSIYNVAGSYTVTLPPSTTTIDFEMIGAGGSEYGIGGYPRAGPGGYMKGIINVPPNVSTIKIKVGSSQVTPAPPAGASYITVPSIGPLFAIVGAGGAASFNFAGFTPLGSGGSGGGGAFVNGVSPGLDGSPCSGPNICGGGGSQLNSPGSPQGGTAGYTCDAPYTIGSAGESYSTSRNFEESLGGAGFAVAIGNYIVSGGSGYAGGGSGCGGGGGSSYYDSSYVSIITSYNGTTASTVGVLPGYGRQTQSGYVSVVYYTGKSSLLANGNVLCNNLMANGSVIVPSGSLTIGSAAGTFPLEIMTTEMKVFFPNGWRYGNGGAAANTGQYDTINVKSAAGIWATIFYAASDKRIKHEISSIRDDDALQIVRKIDPVRYKYIDSALRHNELEYGFIAQDVKSVLPYSVRTETDFIPNIYDLGDFTKIDSGAFMITIRNKTVEHVSIGDSIKIIDLKEVQHVCKILDVNYNYLIVDTDLDNIVSKPPLTIQDIENGVQSNTVFVFGTRVDDLHVLDKHAIYSVNVAAVQEIDRIQQQQVSTIQGQEVRIKALEDKLELLSNKL